MAGDEPKHTSDLSGIAARHPDEVKAMAEQGTWDALRTREFCEYTYRRGYRQGYATALRDFLRLLHEHPSKAEAVHEYLERWTQYGDLFQWMRMGDWNSNEPPPSAPTPDAAALDTEDPMKAYLPPKGLKSIVRPDRDLRDRD